MNARCIWIALAAVPAAFTAAYICSYMLKLCACARLGNYLNYVAKYCICYTISGL